MPFPGGARSARADEGRALAEMAAQREAVILRKVTAEAVNSFAAAQAAYGGWQSAQSAADKMRGNAELMARAYALGEMGLPEVLTARRQALEANLAAALARLEAANPLSPDARCAPAVAAGCRRRGRGARALLSFCPWRQAPAEKPDNLQLIIRRWRRHAQIKPRLSIGMLVHVGAPPRRECGHKSRRGRRSYSGVLALTDNLG